MDGNLGGVGDYFFIRIMLDTMSYVILCKNTVVTGYFRNTQQQECTDVDV